MGERIVNVHKQEYKGKKFRSTLETKTAQTLDALGIPYQYEERKIILMDGFKSPFQKEKVRSVTYTPDFIIGPIMLECKGFETPEWKLKRKLVFKYLLENEPETLFYQLHDAKASLLKMLDNHWACLGVAIKVTNKPTKKEPAKSQIFDSIAQALEELNIGYCPLGSIMSGLTGKRDYIKNYKWELVKV